MKILLAATSTEDFSGASKCLLELASSLTRHGQEVVVSLPKVGGSIETALSEKNIPFVVMREYQCWYKEKNETPSPITTALKRVMNKITVAKCRKYLRIKIIHSVDEFSQAVEEVLTHHDEPLNLKKAETGFDEMAREIKKMWKVD